MLPNLNSSYVKIYDNYASAPRIKQMKSNKELEGVIDAVGKWRFYLGIKEKASAEEIVVLVNFIKDQFGNLTVADLHEAITMSIAGKLDVDNETYGNFSPLYVSRILNAYSNQRTQIISECKRLLKKHEAQKPKPKVSAEVMHKNMRIAMVRNWNTVKEGRFFYDYGSVMYRYIKHNKLMKPSEDLIERARVYGKEQAMAESREGALVRINMSHVANQDERQERAKTYSRYFIVNEWFKSIKSEQELLDLITKESIQFIVDDENRR